MAKKAKKKTTRRPTKRAPRRKQVEEKAPIIIEEETMAWTVASALEGIANGLHAANENIDAQLDHAVKVREEARGAFKRAEAVLKLTKDELFQADSYVCRIGKMKDLLSGV